ncbi:iron chelate uptake ABC transporter family permease subunit [Riemerella columbina]|uniref:iron chelate uptake ABC transporter family permease subunit n=1 Tax=Riemerella columbina TaxID=103810 RepID=UPI00037B02FF|nr:iron chelate uptake ABC transporter family permease subunit [Riemerella columbina]
MFKIGFKQLIISISLAVMVLITVNLNIGYIHLEPIDFFQNTPHHQIAELRIQRVFAMLIAGIAIPTSGFLLQEYFQNPLAGPSVLGITSVASLSVALFIFFSNQIIIPEFLQNGLMSLVAVVGSLSMMGILLLFSKTFKDTSFLIIFGFLVSALAGAVVSIMQVYADNQSFKHYILWSFGANNQLNFNQLILLSGLIILGLGFSFKSIKPLIGNALGTSYAQSFGVNLKGLKFNIILGSSLLAAGTTAFLGPILFIGIIVPHFSRMVYNPALLWQQWLLNLTIGMALMQGFSIISEVSSLPINIITSVFGIPVILLMLIKRKHE